MLDRQPVLEGPTLLLRPLRADDWDALYAVASDPLIWEVHPAHDRWQEEVFRAFFADALANGGALAVIDKTANDTGGAIIGSSRYQGLEDFAVGEANIRSRRAMEKIGARLTERSEQRGMAGVGSAHVFYVIGKAEFEGGVLGQMEH